MENLKPVSFIYQEQPLKSEHSICHDCCIAKALLHITVKHNSALMQTQPDPVHYTDSALSKALIGMILISVRARDGKLHYTPGELMMYPSEHSFRFALTLIPSSCGKIFETEKITHLPDLLIKATDHLSGLQLIRYSAFALLTFAHTFLISGITSINFRNAHYDGLDVRGFGPTYSLYFQEAFDLDCGGANVIASRFSISHVFKQAYKSVDIHVDEIHPCISVTVHNAVFGDSTQYTKTITHAMKNAFTYIISRAQVDATMFMQSKMQINEKLTFFNNSNFNCALVYYLFTRNKISRRHCFVIMHC